MRIKRFIIILLIISPILVSGQNSLDRYNLDFEYPLISQNSTWLIMQDEFRFGQDSIEKVHGNKSFILSRLYLKRKFLSCLYQTILLPYPGNRIEVSIYSKRKLLQSAWVKINCYDSSRKFIGSDSVSIISDEWQKFSIKFNSVENIYFLNVEIWAAENFKEKKLWVHLWVDDMQIKINDRDLYSYDDNKTNFGKRDFEDIKNNISIEPDHKIPLNQIVKIGGKKIYGFGETTHGSKEILLAAYNNIKQLIINQNCRLVLLEMPLDIGMRVNQYVNEGITDESIKEVLADQNTSIELISFLEWIKNFNNTDRSNVTVFGIDNRSNDWPRHFNNFLLSKSLVSTKIDTLLNHVNSYTSRVDHLNYARRNKKEFIEILNEQDYKTVVHYLENRTDSLLYSIIPFESMDWYSAYRDYIMFVNTRFAIENYSNNSSSVAIYAHLNHLIKNTPIFLTSIRSLGQYIFENYKDDYYLTGLLFAEGSINVRSILDRNYSIQKIYAPIPNSLEYLCAQSDKESFFKKLPLSLSEPVMIRKTGAYFLGNQQFIPIVLNGSMDAFIFIKHSTPPVFYQDNIPFSKRHDLYMERLNQAKGSK